MFTPFKFVNFNIIGLLDCDKTRVTSPYLAKLQQQERRMKPFTLKCGDKLAVTLFWTDMKSQICHWRQSRVCIRNTTKAVTVLYCSNSTDINLCLRVLQLRIQPRPLGSVRKRNVATSSAATLYQLIDGSSSFKARRNAWNAVLFIMLQ
jgi:hypothetical protein